MKKQNREKQTEKLNPEKKKLHNEENKETLKHKKENLSLLKSEKFEKTFYL